MGWTGGGKIDMVGSKGGLVEVKFIGGKSQKCFWEPDYWFENFLRKCVYSQAKNFSKQAIPLKNVEIAL